MKNRSLLAVVAAAATLGLTGCTPYTGINSLPLPGTVGTGPDSYEIKVQLHDADSLVANTPVFVNDINVGTTTLVALDGWTPTLTLSLGKDVKLPANATAALAQTSLLGSKHIDLITPPNPQGTLQPGATITEDRIHQFPETEDLLAGVSVLLNGGGLQHIQTITTELNRALGGSRANDAKELLTQLNGFTAGLDQQTGDITTALKSFDHLGATLAPRMQDIDTGIQQLPRGLDTLDDLEPQLVSTLHDLGQASEAIAPFADEGSDQLRHIFDELRSPLRHFGDIQKGSLPRALRVAPFLIFPIDGIQYLVRGDYANLNVVVNLDLPSLDKNLFTGTPMSGLLTQGAYALGRKGGPDAGSNAGLPLRGVPRNPLPVGPLNNGPSLSNGSSSFVPDRSGSGPLSGGLPKIGN